MILSFSIPAMRPMIEAGIRQANGEHVTERVKRQTIRELKPGGRYEHLLNNLKYIEPVDLHIWWKSRTKQRAKLGVVLLKTVEPIIIKNLDGRLNLLTDGGPGGRYIVWAPYFVAHDDGFEDAAAFRNFFVPKPGDTFDGVLIKW